MDLRVAYAGCCDPAYDNENKGAMSLGIYFNNITFDIHFKMIGKMS